MSKVRALAEELCLPKETLPFISELPDYSAYAVRLCGEGYADAAEELHNALGADEGGWKMLSVQLTGALLAREQYIKKGISDEIFLDTMGCFNRFVREHRESFGAYGFDRWWWTGRQLSLTLFRIGALEYELCTEDGENLISVHIPSDADLSDGAVDKSLISARAFLKEYFPAYGDAEFHCHSWLLSPVLGQLLPAESRINKFRKRFTILGFDENADDYKLWVYKNKSLSLEEFPENTTLQRVMKAHLVRGGKVGAAWGKIR